MHVSRRARLSRAVMATCGISALVASSTLAGSSAAAAGPNSPESRPTPRAGTVITLTTAKVGAPGNPSVGVVPFTDAVYRSCSDAPTTSGGCLMVGGVSYPYEIGQLEVTVGQWVAFVDNSAPKGTEL